MNGLFVTGTGTGAGKTTVGAALAASLVASGREVVALKPIETGVDPIAADAILLAAACGRPELAHDPAWYRAALPASPYAAILEGAPALEVDRLVARIRALATDRFALVEGAGGLLVPLSADETLADLARALAMPLLLVAPDRLGVLSEVLSTLEAAEHRGLAVAAIALNRVSLDTDPSMRTNARILAERARCPVIPIAHGPVDATALRDALGLR